MRSSQCTVLLLISTYLRLKPAYRLSSVLRSCNPLVYHYATQPHPSTSLCPEGLHLKSSNCISEEISDLRPLPEATSLHTMWQSNLYGWSSLPRLRFPALVHCAGLALYWNISIADNFCCLGSSYCFLVKNGLHSTSVIVHNTSNQLLFASGRQPSSSMSPVVWGKTISSSDLLNRLHSHQWDESSHSHCKLSILLQIFNVNHTNDVASVQECNHSTYIPLETIIITTLYNIHKTLYKQYVQAIRLAPNFHYFTQNLSFSK